MRTVKIVHVSDLHVKESAVDELKIRLAAFFEDVEKICHIPDFLVISGDLAFSGKREEYALVDELVLRPFIARFNLEPRRVIVSMGNHDINRDRVNSVIRDGVLSQLSSNGGAMESVQYQQYADSWVEFFNCAQQYSMDKSCLFGTNIFEVDGIKIGFVSYNSALVCFDRDVKKEDLYLTKEQLKKIPDELESCAIKVGVMHHPLDWLSAAERDIVIPDLRHKTPILLTGHMHDETSLATNSPDGCNLSFTTTSFFAGQDYSPNHRDGYGIYEIDVDSCKVKAQYRSFIRRRRVYAANQDHSDNGLWEVTLDRSVFRGQGNLLMVRDTQAVAEKLSGTLDNSLKVSQKIDAPVYVDPLISRITVDAKGKRTSVSVAVNQCDSFSKINILFAPCDVGSSVYLQKLCIEAAKTTKPMFYVTASELKNIHDESAVRSFLSSKYAIKRKSVDISQSGLVIDEVGACSPGKLKELREIASGFAQLFICVKSELLFDSLVRGNIDPNVSFYEFRYWGASKIREFIMAYGAAAGIDLSALDSIRDFVVKSFSASDIHVTPQLVSLYLRMFKDGTASLDGVSVVELLQQLEQAAMASCKDIQSGDRYYCQQILQILARKCLEQRSFAVQETEVCAEFDAMIQKAGLSLIAKTVVEALCEVGVITRSLDSEISFSSYVFLWYYLAQVIAGDEKLLEKSLARAEDAVMLGKAAAYFVAKRRSERSIVDKLIEILHSRHPELTEIKPEQFEEYADDILFPTQEKSADEAAQQLSAKSPDVLMTDRDFEERQQAERSGNERHFAQKKTSDSFDQVDIDLSVLRMVYNVFRNLEMISEDEKRTLINQILNYCLHVGMRLVGVFAEFVKEHRKLSSFFAYVVFLFNVEFISENIASKKLGPTLEKVFDDTDNELKKLFLIMMMKACGVRGAEDKLVLLMKGTRHRSIVEMGYFEIREWLIGCKQERVPSHLVEVFKEIFIIRNGKCKYGDEQMVNLELAEIQNVHLSQMQKKIVVAGREIEK